MNTGTLAIKNSTIAENSGGVVGGVYNTGGFVGGVLFSGGSNMELYNTLLAGNTNGDCFGGVNAGAGNLIVSGSCGSAITADPLLGALTGSPRHNPLGSGSPAIDAGASGHCLAIDQLGNSRPQGADCDIGAIELQAQITEPSPTATATNTFTATATTTPTATTAAATDTPTTTDTPVPTHTPVTADAKAVVNVQLTSNQPGELAVSWDAPSQTPRDYRINWAKVGEAFPRIRENIGNAFPTSPSYTISGLEQGVTYKVKLRARYSGETNGDWTEEYTAVVTS